MFIYHVFNDFINFIFLFPGQMDIKRSVEQDIETNVLPSNT